MYDEVAEACIAVREARQKVLKALIAATRDGKALDLAKKLTGLEYALRAAEFTAADAANAALIEKTTRAFEQPPQLGGTDGT